MVRLARRFRDHRGRHDPRARRRRRRHLSELGRGPSHRRSRLRGPLLRRRPSLRPGRCLHRRPSPRRAPSGLRRLRRQASRQHHPRLSRAPCPRPPRPEAPRRPRRLRTGSFPPPWGLAVGHRRHRRHRSARPAPRWLLRPPWPRPRPRDRRSLFPRRSRRPRRRSPPRIRSPRSFSETRLDPSRRPTRRRRSRRGWPTLGSSLPSARPSLPRARSPRALDAFTTRSPARTRVRSTTPRKHASTIFGRATGFPSTSPRYAARVACSWR